MRLKITFAILVISAMFSIACFAAENKEKFIENMGSKVLSILKDDKKSLAERRTMLRGLFTEVVDTDWIAKFVLGPAWKTATPEQKTKYIGLYRTYLTETYISKFDEDSDSKVSSIKIINVKEAGQDMFTAHTEIVQTGNEPAVKVDYLLREKNGLYKIIDINIEGVSLLNTHRQEFSALAGKNGIDGVINKLTELTDHQKQN